MVFHERDKHGQAARRRLWWPSCAKPSPGSAWWRSAWWRDSVSPPSFLSAALIKALLSNGADIISDRTPNFIPSNDSGFGRVNMANAIAVVHGEPRTGFHEGKLCNVTKEWLKNIVVESGYTTLRATLVWTDPPGGEIQNQLQMEVQDATELKRPYSGDTVQQVIWSPASPRKSPLKWASSRRLRNLRSLFWR